MEILIDACTVILLGKATVLRTIAENFSLVTTEEVEAEIVQEKEQMRMDALLFEKLRSENKIKLIRAKKRIIMQLKRDFGLDKGEASLIAVNISEQKRMIASDNKQCRKVAKIYGYTIVGSNDIIVHGVKKKLISADKANAALETLTEAGWFKPYLIEKSKEDIKNE